MRSSISCRASLACVGRSPTARKKPAAGADRFRFTLPGGEIHRPYLEDLQRCYVAQAPNDLGGADCLYSRTA